MDWPANVWPLLYLNGIVDKLCKEFAAFVAVPIGQSCTWNYDPLWIVIIRLLSLLWLPDWFIIFFLRGCFPINFDDEQIVFLIVVWEFIQYHIMYQRIYRAVRNHTLASEFLDLATFDSSLRYDSNQLPIKQFQTRSQAQLLW